MNDNTNVQSQMYIIIVFLSCSMFNVSDDDDGVVIGLRNWISLQKVHRKSNQC